MQHLALLFGSEAVGRPCVQDFEHAEKTADQLLAVLTSYFASYILIDQTVSNVLQRPSVLKPQQSSSLLIVCIHGFGCAPAELQLQRRGCGLRLKAAQHQELKTEVGTSVAAAISEFVGKEDYNIEDVAATVEDKVTSAVKKLDNVDLTPDAAKAGRIQGYIQGFAVVCFRKVPGGSKVVIPVAVQIKEGVKEAALASTGGAHARSGQGLEWGQKQEFDRSGGKSITWLLLEHALARLYQVRDGMRVPDVLLVVVPSDSARLPSILEQFVERFASRSLREAATSDWLYVVESTPSGQSCSCEGHKFMSVGCQTEVVPEALIFPTELLRRARAPDFEAATGLQRGSDPQDPLMLLMAILMDMGGVDVIHERLPYEPGSKDDPGLSDAVRAYESFQGIDHFSWDHLEGRVACLQH
ncbi:unnamed protein product, partial [Symbiodinium sp. KB8]